MVVFPAIVVVVVVVVVWMRHKSSIYLKTFYPAHSLRTHPRSKSREEDNAWFSRMLARSGSSSNEMMSSSFCLK